MRNLDNKYGDNIKMPRRFNRAIRAEILGGNELLDLLELVSNIRQRPATSADSKKFLKRVEYALQEIRQAFIDEIVFRYKNPVGLDEVRNLHYVESQLAGGQDITQLVLRKLSEMLYVMTGVENEEKENEA